MALAMMYPESENGGRGKRSSARNSPEIGGFKQQRLSEARAVLRHSRPLAESVLKGITPLDACKLLKVEPQFDKLPEDTDVLAFSRHAGKILPLTLRAVRVQSRCMTPSREDQLQAAHRALQWRQFRRDRLFSQTDLAQALGLCRRAVVDIECARVIHPRVATLKKFQALQRKHQRAAVMDERQAARRAAFAGERVSA